MTHGLARALRPGSQPALRTIVALLTSLAFTGPAAALTITINTDNGTSLGQTAGNGGTGGNGGGGAGGTVKLSGSVMSVAGASVDTRGGVGPGSAANGGNGRLILASNVIPTAPVGLSGVRVQAFDGPVGANPFISIGGPSNSPYDAPYIADLAGGAETFGLLAGIDASTLDFASLRAAAPAGALVALWRTDVGPTGYADDYRGHDMLLFVNLTDGALLDPTLGVEWAAGAGGRRSR